jgi:hypothetical protein
MEDNMSELDDLWESSDEFTADDLEDNLQSKFLSGTSLGNNKLRLTITGVKNMPLRDSKTGNTEKKPVLGFTNGQLLPLNKTNLRSLKEKLGNPAKWPGAMLDIYTETTSMGPGIRLSVVTGSKTKSVPVSTDPDMNDDIPF